VAREARLGSIELGHLPAAKIEGYDGPREAWIADRHQGPVVLLDQIALRQLPALPFRLGVAIDGLQASAVLVAQMLGDVELDPPAVARHIGAGQGGRRRAATTTRHDHRRVRDQEGRVSAQHAGLERREAGFGIGTLGAIDVDRFEEAEVVAAVRRRAAGPAVDHHIDRGTVRVSGAPFGAQEEPERLAIRRPWLQAGLEIGG
jgi:hypothetical protein